jgi:hypothetical protein
VHLGLLGRVDLAQGGLVFDGRLGHGREVANVVAKSLLEYGTRSTTTAA